MTVTVWFFAWLREIVGMEVSRLELPNGSDGHTLKAVLEQHHAGLRGLLDTCRLAVHLEYRSWAAALQHGDELYVIPPVSGG
jgi:molybdopterin converting factor subunit 1